MKPIFIELTKIRLAYSNILNRYEEIDKEIRFKLDIDCIGDLPAEQYDGFTILNHKYLDKAYFVKESPEEIQKLINEAYEKENNPFQELKEYEIIKNDGSIQKQFINFNFYKITDVNETKDNKTNVCFVFNPSGDSVDGNIIINMPYEQFKKEVLNK